MQTTFATGAIMNKFDGVIEFIAVVESKGFSAAAKRLGLSTSQVSRRVASLESRLGVPLIIRSTRKVSLTKEGTIYYSQGSKLINGFDRMNDQICTNKVEIDGLLRVAAGGPFDESIVIPALFDFIKLHPKLRLNVDYSPNSINLAKEGFDFAIRYGQLNDRNLVGREILNHQYTLVASMEYLEKSGEPNKPSDIHFHDCIVSTNNQWSFIENDKPMHVSVKGKIRLNNLKSIINACKAGLGIAYLPKSFLDEYIRSGELVSLLENYCTMEKGTWLVYPSKKHLSLKARLAIDFLHSRFIDGI